MRERDSECVCVGVCVGVCVCVCKGSMDGGVWSEG